MAHLNFQNGYAKSKSADYHCKIKNFCDCIDPFTLDVRRCADEIPNNVGYFDIVNYCIEHGNLYSWQSFKIYKRMDAFQFFKSGFVQQTLCLNIKEKSLILALDSQIEQSTASDRNSLKAITKIETFERDTRMDKSSTEDRNSSKSESKLGTIECDSWIVQSSNRSRKSSILKSKLETFECDKCFLTFNRKWNLDRHLSRHKIRDRPNIFFPKSTLKVHADGIEESQFLPLKLSRKPKSLHEDEGKDFLCSICAQLFRQKGSLTQHMKLHGDLSNTKPKIEFSNDERNAIFQFLLSRTNDGKLKNGAMKEAANEFNCNRGTISRIWKRAQQSYAKGNKCVNVESLKKTNCGRKRKDYSENISRIHEVPLKHRRSFRSLSDAIGVPKSTLYHILKRSKAKVDVKD